MSQDQQDKVIKVRVDADNPSTQRTKAAIDSITASAEKLAQTLEKVTRAMEGFSKAQGKTRGINVGKGPTHPGKTSGGLAESVIGDASGIRNAAKATETALSVTGANIKRFVDSAIKDIARLRSATGNIGLNAGATGGGGTNLGTAPTILAGGGGLSAGGGAGGAGGGGAGGAGGGAGGGGGSGGGSGGRSPKSKSFWGAGGFPGYLENRGQAFGQAVGLGLPGARIFGGLGRLAGSAGAVGGAAAGVAVVAELGAEAWESTRPERLKYTLNQPFMAKKAAAANANIYNRLFGAVMNRDMAYQIAFNNATNDKKAMESLGNVKLRKEQLERMYVQAPASAKSAIKYLLNEGISVAGDAASTLWNKIQGREDIPDVVKESTRRLLYKTAAYGAVGEQAESFEQLVQSHKSLNAPMLNFMANKISGSAMDRVKLLRLAGISPGLNKKGELVYESLESRLTPKGWENSDIASGHQGILGIGAGYQKVISPITFVGDPQAGFTNIGSVIQMGGMMGGSVKAARSFYDIAQRSMGRGRLDVATVNQMFPSLAQSLNATGAFGVGSGYSDYIANAAGLVGGIEGGKGTLDVAQQQRNLALLQQGNPILNSYSTGSRAPLFAATSMIRAIGTTGQYDTSAQALSTMPIELQYAIANRGKIPDYYSLIPGITKESVTKFMTGGAKDLFLQPLETMMSGPGLDLYKAAKNKIYGGGTFGDFLTEQTQGLKGKTKREQGGIIIRQLAGLMSASGNTGTPQENESALFSSLAGTSWASAFGKGGGVHAGGVGNGPEAAFLRGQGKVLEQQAKSMQEGVYGQPGVLDAILAAFEEMPQKLVDAMKGVEIVKKEHARKGNDPEKVIGAVHDSLSQTTKAVPITPDELQTFQVEGLKSIPLGD